MGFKHRGSCGISSLGVDEMAIGKGHDYYHCRYQIDADKRRLLWIGKDRKAQNTYYDFLLSSAKKRSPESFRIFAVTMWRPYLKSYRQENPQALNILTASIL